MGEAKKKTDQQWLTEIRVTREKKGRELSLIAWCPVCGTTQTSVADLKASTDLNELQAKNKILHHIKAVHLKQ